MQFTDICLVSDDVLRLVDFYEKLFDVQAIEKSALHSGLNVGGLNLTIDGTPLSEDNPAFNYISGESSNNTIIGFNVGNVDAEYRRVKAFGVKTLNEPTTHPWGARSFQFRDLDGNIINFRSFPKGAGYERT
ncbi:glyoxalase [Clostridia bacterium]|nr:glyoxalase [Clostridia bacterium]GHV36300.1 glyoxalase [Clostridia bacterium]